MQHCRPPTKMANLDLQSEAALFKAIGDAHRLNILATLARVEGEVCVCDFTDGLPLNQPTVSHHLRILREAELVTCERRGTWVYYRLAASAHERLGDALASIFRQKVLA